MLGGWKQANTHLFSSKMSVPQEASAGSDREVCAIFRYNGLDQYAMAELDFGLFSLRRWELFYTWEEEWKVFSDYKGSPWKRLSWYRMNTFPLIPGNTAGPHFAIFLKPGLALWLSSSPSNVVRTTYTTSKSDTLNVNFHSYPSSWFFPQTEGTQAGTMEP